MNKSDVIATVAVVLAATALLRPNDSGPTVSSALPSETEQQVTSAVIQVNRAAMPDYQASLDQLQSRIEQRLDSQSERLDRVDNYMLYVQQLEDALLAQIAATSTDSRDSNSRYTENGEEDRARPQYVSITSPADFGVSVEQDYDGSLVVFNDNPDLSMQPIVVEAEHEDGTIEQIVLTVPPVDQ